MPGGSEDSVGRAAEAYRFCVRDVASERLVRGWPGVAYVSSPPVGGVAERSGRRISQGTWHMPGAPPDRVSRKPLRPIAHCATVVTGLPVPSPSAAGRECLPAGKFGL